MMLNSNTSKSFWSEAVLAAVYLINRSPTSALQDKVPAELWYGKRPDLRKLRIFGSIAYLHIPKEIVGGKFESRSKKCHVIGYCPKDIDCGALRTRSYSLAETLYLTNLNLILKMKISMIEVCRAKRKLRMR